MAGASLSRLPEESVTDSGEIIEPDSFRIGAKPVDDFFSTFHIEVHVVNGRYVVESQTP